MMAWDPPLFFSRSSWEEYWSITCPGISSDAPATIDMDHMALRAVPWELEMKAWTLRIIRSGKLPEVKCETYC
jgi:hypothetical protein